MEQWERQENETALQYSYFKAYLDLGVLRTLPKVQQQYGKSIAYFKNYPQKTTGRYDLTLMTAILTKSPEKKTSKQSKKQIKKISKLHR